jgi:hypothetical protein
VTGRKPVVTDLTVGVFSNVEKSLKVWGEEVLDGVEVSK